MNIQFITLTFINWVDNLNTGQHGISDQAEYRALVARPTSKVI